VPTRRRIDAELVRRGLVSSRAAAVDAIADGRVTVNGAPVERPARLVAPGDQLLLAAGDIAYVARSGAKLQAVFDTFPDRSPESLRAVDCGSSTGGFTECLLRYGAASVCAIDVGTHQLHERLRNDARVTVWEQTDIRSVDHQRIGAPFDIAVVDLSFISLLSVRDALLGLCSPGSAMILLVKPHFEVGKVEAARHRGVIRDDSLRARARDRVIDAFEDAGCTAPRWIESPVAGSSGNREYLVDVVTPS